MSTHDHHCASVAACAHTRAAGTGRSAAVLRAVPAIDAAGRRRITYGGFASASSREPVRLASRATILRASVTPCAT
ncbi:MAG TPA: hypothetical protein VFP80_18040 [Thermoanaerobaculia bacterium]|nr:hypothetical protein [Thermoanaerobaculia bacterium]